LLIKYISLCGRPLFENSGHVINQSDLHIYSRIINFSAHRILGEIVGENASG